MESSDKITLNLKDNPEMQAALAGASAGDTITLKEVTFIIDEISTDSVTGSVDDCDCDEIKVTPGPDSEDDGSEDEQSKDVVSVMASNYKK